VEKTLSELAELTGGRVNGEGSIIVSGVATLRDARQGSVSFLADRRFEQEAAATRASALIVGRPTPLFDGPQLIAENPLLAFAKIATIFAPPPQRHQGVSHAASIDKTAELGADVSIYPGVFVGAGAKICDRVTLFPGVYVGENATVGRDTLVYPNVTIMNGVAIGNRVILHAGVVIGSDGFGFVRDGASSFKIPQLGTVRIEDDVEIGANCCIDRAALGETVVGRGVKMDNLIQVGHNVVIGEDSIIVAQAGISGSVRIGRQVVLGGQVGVADHLEIGDRAMVGSQSGIAKSVPPGEVVSGTPAIPHRRWLRASGLMARLPDIVDRLKKLERGFAELCATVRDENQERKV
jgi:UDP-3-O-[3-hydroxymyristoyl] glucosamine N-acyltransferase